MSDDERTGGAGHNGDGPASGDGLRLAGAGGGPELAAVGSAGVASGSDQVGGVEPGEPSLSASIEAILLVVDEPVDEVTLAQVLETPRDEVAATLQRLANEYEETGRGFELRPVAGGWRLYTRPECAPLVERFVLDGQQAKLTQAALETLAVVAYRQPVSRARVSAVRGVSCDGVMRTLTTRGLVEEAGVDPDSGATLYRTSSYFLERLGMTSLDELPPLVDYLPNAEDVEDEADRSSDRASASAELMGEPDSGDGDPSGDEATRDQPDGGPVVRVASPTDDGVDAVGDTRDRDE